MNTSVAILFLLLAAAGLLALPLMPAIDELRKKHDAQPLSVIQQYAGEIRHFASGFRNYIEPLQQPLQECVTLRTTTAGVFHEDDEYLLLGEVDQASLPKLVGQEGTTCPMLVASGVDLVLPDGLTFRKEIFAAGQFVGGEQSTYRAILGDKQIHLQRASKVLRWAHAAGRFQVDHNCDLYGRVSSDQQMLLQSGCFFQRLNAPCIVMGSPDVSADSNGSAAALFSAEPTPDGPARRRLIEGDWEIQPGEVVRENIVSRGKLHIGAGARIFGSAKSNGKMVVGPDVVVEGSLISAATMHIGPRCQVRGPVISEREMVIQSGAQCGAPQIPTTVSAPIIDAEEGSLFFGTLWAREQGRVIPKT